MATTEPDECERCGRWARPEPGGMQLCQRCEREEWEREAAPLLALLEEAYQLLLDRATDEDGPVADWRYRVRKALDGAD